MDNRHKNPDNDPRGSWKAVDATVSLSDRQRGAQYTKTGVSVNIYELITPFRKNCDLPKENIGTTQKTKGAEIDWALNLTPIA